MTVSQLVYAKMIEIAKLIHTAIKSDSTWSVVLVLGVVGFIGMGTIGYLLNSAYLSDLPHFEMQIQTLIFGEPEGPYRGKGGMVIIKAVVTNPGNPSAIQDWNLYVQLPDGSKVRAAPAPTDTQMTLSDMGIVLQGSDALYRKTITAIGPGQIVPGFLVFVVLGQPKDVLLRSDVKYQLVATDAYGKNHTKSFTRADLKDEAHYPLY